MSEAATKGETLENEHIFPATQLTTLALRWKELVKDNRHEEALAVLNDIIVGSTPMFERFAQHEGYHRTVPLDALVAAAQEKVVRWLIHWRPKKGRLFTWFSKCAKNAFRSEVAKTMARRKKLHTFDETPEKLIGSIDPTADLHAVAIETHKKIRDITSRWGTPRELGALKYVLLSFEEVQDSPHDKQAVIRGIQFAYCLTHDQAKFFYNWAIIAIRNVMYDRVFMPFTEQDLLRAKFSHTLIPDLLDIMPWETVKKFIAIFGGQRLRIPTLTQIVRLKEMSIIAREIENSDMDPDSITKIARSHSRTERTAQELFEEMIQLTDPHLSGEYEIFGQYHDDPVVGHGHH